MVTQNGRVNHTGKLLSVSKQGDLHTESNACEKSIKEQGSLQLHRFCHLQLHVGWLGKHVRRTQSMPLDVAPRTSQRQHNKKYLFQSVVQHFDLVFVLFFTLVGLEGEEWQWIQYEYRNENWPRFNKVFGFVISYRDA